MLEDRDVSLPSLWWDGATQLVERGVEAHTLYRGQSAGVGERQRYSLLTRSTRVSFVLRRRGTDPRRMWRPKYVHEERLRSVADNLYRLVPPVLVPTKT